MEQLQIVKHAVMHLHSNIMDHLRNNWRFLFSMFFTVPRKSVFSSQENLYLNCFKAKKCEFSFFYYLNTINLNRMFTQYEPKWSVIIWNKHLKNFFFAKKTTQKKMKIILFRKYHANTRWMFFFMALYSHICSTAGSTFSTQHTQSTSNRQTRDFREQGGTDPETLDIT